MAILHDNGHSIWSRWKALAVDVVLKRIVTKDRSCSLLNFSGTLVQGSEKNNSERQEQMGLHKMHDFEERRATRRRTPTKPKRKNMAPLFKNSCPKQLHPSHL